MIRSSASLAADDFSISCRIRRSKLASKPEFQSYVPMKCTMRNWVPPSAPQSLEKTNSNASNPSAFTRKLVEHDVNHTGPELRLIPLLEPSQLTREVPSFGSQNSRISERSRRKLRRQSSQSSRSQSGSVGKHSGHRIWSAEDDYRMEGTIEPFSIPLTSIVVVDTKSSETSPLYLTTTSHGYVEFTFQSINAHDVLLAFLAASLPPERITSCDRCPTPVSSDNSNGNGYDVDMLTANRIHERVRSETFVERLRRKSLFFINRVGELTLQFSECACACQPNNNTYYDASNEKERFATHRRYDFEMETSPAKTPRPDLDSCQIPSGLSLEGSRLDGSVVHSTATDPH